MDKIHFNISIPTMTTTTKQQAESLRERLKKVAIKFGYWNHTPFNSHDAEWNKGILDMLESVVTSDRPTVDMRGVEESASQQSTIADKWISVDERLPELGSMVLAGYFLYSPLIGNQFNQEVIFYDAISNDKFEYWQPLPTPPATNKNETI